MANYTINSTSTISSLGDVDVYIGGKTSTTLIDTYLMDLSDIVYDLSKLEGVYSGQLTLKLANYDDNVLNQHSNIKNQIWIIEVGGDEHFRGFPIVSSMRYTKSSKANEASVTLSADFLNPSSVDFSGLTLYDGYSLSDVIETIILDKSGVGTVNYINSSTDLVYNISESGTLDVFFDKNDATGSDEFVVVPTESSKTPLQITNNFALNYIFYKGEAYFWLKNSYNSTTAIDEDRIVNKLTLTPDNLVTDYFDSLKMGINIESFDFQSSGIWSLYSLELLQEDDKFSQYSTAAFASTNWTDLGTFNIAHDIYDNTGFFNGTGRVGFLISTPASTTAIELDTSDFNESLVKGDNLKISLGYDVSYPTLNTGTTGAEVFERFVDTVDLVIKTKGALGQLVTTISNEQKDYVELEYSIDTLDDLQLSIENVQGDMVEDDGTYKSLTVPLGTEIYYDNVNMVTIIDSAYWIMSDYVTVTGAGGFNGIYRIVTRTYNGAGSVLHGLDVLNTTSTTPTSCGTTMEIGFYFNNLQIGIDRGQYKELVDYGYNSGSSLAPLYDGADNDNSRELQNSILKNSINIYNDLYGTSNIERLVFETRQEIDPFDRLTRDSKNYLIRKWGYSIKNGVTKITADRIT